MRKSVINEIEHHYYKVDDLLVRITTHTVGWINPGRISSDPSFSIPPDGESITFIMAVDIKSPKGWTCFDESLRKAQQWHGMTIGEAEKNGLNMSTDLAAHQLYETARIMIEEKKYFGLHIEETPEYDIPKGDRL